MRAALAIGEEVFAALGYTVLAPSRPGYGRTPVTTGRTPGGFADISRELCSDLGIDQVAAAVGISGGGPTAVAMAARHAGLVRRLVLESAVGPLSWPDPRTRLGARLALNRVTERASWTAVRALLRIAPMATLRFFLTSLSTDPPSDVLASLAPNQRSGLLTLLSRMSSGSGFVNDLRQSANLTAQVSQPTLVIATRKDGAVPFAHAQALAAGIADSRLVVSEANTHLIWLGSDYPVIAESIRKFLGADTIRA
jgi:pimeloyl-ACP methyl ester carboxylesterase